MKQASCEERIGAELESTLATLRDLWELNCEDPEAYHPEHGTNFSEYGLCFDYVEPGTFGDQQEQGYFRYQLSWGGPSDEFRFFVDWEGDPYKIEYWFMDWFDGASRTLYSQDEALLGEIFRDFKGMGMCEHA